MKNCGKSGTPPFLCSFREDLDQPWDFGVPDFGTPKFRNQIRKISRISQLGPFLDAGQAEPLPDHGNVFRWLVKG